MRQAKTRQATRDVVAIQGEIKSTILPALTEALRQSRALMKELRALPAHAEAEAKNDAEGAGNVVYANLTWELSGDLAYLAHEDLKDAIAGVRRSLRKTEESVARDVERWRRERESVSDAAVAS